MTRVAQVGDEAGQVGYERSQKIAQPRLRLRFATFIDQRGQPHQRAVGGAGA
jgi:hypothetical protein